MVFICFYGQFLWSVTEGKGLYGNQQFSESTPNSVLVVPDVSTQEGSSAFWARTSAASFRCELGAVCVPGTAGIIDYDTDVMTHNCVGRPGAGPALRLEGLVKWLWVEPTKG